MFFQQRFYCEYCGAQYRTVRDLTSNLCRRNPAGPKGCHKLYEGTEKPLYTCKCCGVQYRTIADLTVNLCSKSPTGRHQPAL